VAGREWLYDGRDEGGDGGGRERWLVTYADMITLLLVFFIVMYALSSRISGEKFDALASSLATSIKKTATPKPSDKYAFQKDDSKQTRKFKATADAVLESIVRTDPKSDVKIDIDERGLVVSLIDTSFFDSGSAEIKAGGGTLLRKLAKNFKGLPNDIRIEGYTDNRPIHTAKFPSNWELSAARATSVARFLITNIRLPSHRISVGAFAENRPVASNGTSEGRKRNRRVDIIILKQEEGVVTGVGAGLPVLAPSTAPAATSTPATPPPNKGFNNPFQ
jgi:chemotaxis protein MotB